MKRKSPLLEALNFIVLFVALSAVFLIMAFSHDWAAP